MGIFNLFKPSKGKKENSIVNDIGTFSFVEFNGTKNYKGNINSKINSNIELLFPVIEKDISPYQIEYFRKIENNWNSVLRQLKIQNSEIDFGEYTVVSIMIPDKENEFYDVDVEIVFKKDENIISIILSDLNVSEIIEI